MYDPLTRLRREKFISLLFVVVVHLAGLYGLWRYELIALPPGMATLFVNFIAPPAPEPAVEPEREPPEQPQPVPVEPVQPRQLVVETPVVTAMDYVAPAPPIERIQMPVISPPMPLPLGPVTLGTELAVGCTERSAPVYPAQSRRLGETGLVVLRVELSESGAVDTARVERSSGHAQLDTAALAAVRTWRCTPATRDGKPVRAVALQPFDFILNGN